ncbi:MAG: hypothetical protein PCFJNLEI_00692 [Verrucomicrobiae bacterium]|nr:hypothetical protein [Verrucomicrobiae bacterium]
MRALALVPLILAPVLHAGDTLKFLNGDRLDGALLNATATGLRWQTPAATQPIVFESTNVAELLLAPRPPRTSRQLHGQLVELTNGDKLAGDIVALDAQTLTLQTWYAGKLRLSRSALKRLESRSLLPSVVYAGPTGPTDWKALQPGWTYKQGRYYSQRNRYSVITKDVGLPAVASIEFDIAWRGQPYWSVGFYTAANQSGYLLTCNGNYLQLHRNVAGNQRNLEGNIQWGEQRPRTKARVAIRVNKPKKTIAVFVDNVLLKQWTDPGEFAGQGTALHFQSQGQADLRLANILVSEWDGKLDTPSDSTHAPAEDLVRLVNGDKVSGVLTAITGGEALLTNSFAAVKIPLPKIVAIEFAKSTPAARVPSSVRADFPDGTQLTLTLEQFDDKNLTGTTDFCGRVVLPADTFTRLRFQPTETGTDDDWEEN